MTDAPKKPKHVPWRKLFRQWHTILLLIVFVIIYLWIFFFVPDPVIEWVASRIGVAKNFGEHIFSLITSASIVGAFGYFVIGDPVLRGNSKAAKYFRGEFPSAKIAKKFNIDSAHASKLFLDYYDCWQFNTEVNYDKYRETTFVRYWCLAVFVLKLMFYGLLVVSLPFLYISMAYQKTAMSAITGQWLIWSFIAVIAILLDFLNRLPSGRRPDPTGCWEAWRRSCEENYMEFVTELGNKTLEKFHEVIRTKLRDLKGQAQ